MALTFSALLIFLIVQRLSELLIARRNTLWLRSHGAVEVGRSHYPFLVALHVLFLAALIVEVWLLHRTPAFWWWVPFFIFLAAQFLRYWTMATLGRRWTTRIIVLPGAPTVSRGPYRFLRHPNYLAVFLELLCVPLIFRAWLTAAVFTTLNLILMAVRIPAEERALRS